MRCKRPAAEVKFNAKDLKNIFKTVSPVEREGCFQVENFDIYYAKVSRSDWKNSDMDLDYFLDDKMGEMLEKWTKMTGKDNVVFFDFRWLDKPRWPEYGGDAIVYAIHDAREPLIKEGVYFIDGKKDINEDGVEYTSLSIRRYGKEPERIDIHESLKFEEHSPTGFSWGYWGSGPAQSALAILIEMLPSKIALNNYRRFMIEVISKIERNNDFSMKMSVKKEKLGNVIGAINCEIDEKSGKWEMKFKIENTS